MRICVPSGVGAFCACIAAKSIQALALESISRSWIGFAGAIPATPRKLKRSWPADWRVAICYIGRLSVCIAITILTLPFICPATRRYSGTCAKNIYAIKITIFVQPFLIASSRRRGRKAKKKDRDDQRRGAPHCAGIAPPPRSQPYMQRSASSTTTQTKEKKPKKKKNARRPV